MTKTTTIKKSKIIDGHHTPQLKQIQDNKGNIIKLEAQFPLLVRENESSWIVYSPHFKTYGYSNKNENDATEGFKIALNTFFKVHTEKGTLEKALYSKGVSRKICHYNLKIQPLFLIFKKSAPVILYLLLRSTLLR